MKQLIFRREARRDALEAFAWYESQEPGLGHEFRDELDATIQRVRASPEASPSRRVRKRDPQLRRLPAVVPQDASQPLMAPDLAVVIGGSRPVLDQPVAQALVVALSVIMRGVLPHDPS